MLLIDEEQIKKHLDWQQTIDSLEQIFAGSCTVPQRRHYTISLNDQQDAAMFLMPAWIAGRYSGLKLISLYPDNNKKGLPTILGTYLLIDGGTGQVLAQLDGAELTARRTVCTSALASKYLSRSDAKRLLIVGSGRLARYLGFAHDAVRPLEDIFIWARNRDKAQEVAEIYLKSGYKCRVVDDLKSGCAGADIISCATMSSEPLIHGEWLQPGTHIDLIGAFTPETRECDDDVVAGSTIFVDTKAGALAEAGDLLIPIKKGIISRSDIAAELSELVLCKYPGRTTTMEITLFKSVGAALEDLGVAVRCYENIVNNDD